jgi:formylglycine-generating enzyme required for sulfatase activity
MQTLNKKQGWRMWLAMALLGAGMAGICEAAEQTIQSSGGAGRLTFDTIPGASGYRLEWAPSSAGPWTNSWASLVDLPGPGSGSITCSVPMCYRVVATLSDLYLVINLSGGPSAATYPVTYLANMPAGGWPDEYKTEKLVMRKISAGTFTMGSPDNERGRLPGETQHLVTLTKDFYIGVFEVTQRQWELVMSNRPSYFNDSEYYAARPVEQVSYEDIRGSSAGAGWPGANAVDAASFMGKLRAKTGLATFDLPAEAQAEYACRAGTTTALNSGKNLTDAITCPNVAEVGRYTYNGAGTAKVGSYLPNAWGLYDMHGNVWEWCLDWYGEYTGETADPDGPESGSVRMMRGGSYGNSAWLCRSAYRYSRIPSDRNTNNGLRVVWNLP